MNLYSWLQFILYMVTLPALAKPLGIFMAKVYQGGRLFIHSFINNQPLNVLNLKGA